MEGERSKDWEEGGQREGGREEQREGGREEQRLGGGGSKEREGAKVEWRREGGRRGQREGGKERWQREGERGPKRGREDMEKGSTGREFVSLPRNVNPAHQRVDFSYSAINEIHTH